MSSYRDGNVLLYLKIRTPREGKTGKKINKEGEGRTVALGVAASPKSAPLFWDECLDQ